VQLDRLLIQAHDGLLAVVGPLIDLQNVFHLSDVVLIEIGHGSG
jgi:hypothetical protein